MIAYVLYWSFSITVSRSALLRRGQIGTVCCNLPMATTVELVGARFVRQGLVGGFVTFLSCEGKNTTRFTVVDTTTELYMYVVDAFLSASVARPSVVSPYCAVCGEGRAAHLGARVAAILRVVLRLPFFHLVVVVGFLCSRFFFLCSTFVWVCCLFSPSLSISIHSFWAFILSRFGRVISPFALAL